MFSVIQFEDGCQLVPSSWIEGDWCPYPPYPSQTRVDSAVKDKETPAESWKRFKVLRNFGPADTFERGQIKLERCLVFSEIETDVEGVFSPIVNTERSRIQKRKHDGTGVERSKTKPVPRIPFLPLGSSRSVGEAVFSEIETDVEAVVSPIVNTERSRIQKRKHDGTGVERSKTKPVPRIPLLPLGSSRSVGEARLNSSIEESPAVEDAENIDMKKMMSFMKKFQNSMFSKFSKMSRRFDNLEEKLEEKEAKLASSSTVEQLESGFPIKSLDFLMETEKKLENKEYHEQLVNSLKGLGGKDFYAITTNILKKYMADDVAELYSWSGQKKKMPFKTLLSFKVVLDAVRCHRADVTEMEVAELISKWLVQAKQRNDRANAKLLKNTPVQD